MAAPRDRHRRSVVHCRGLRVDALIDMTVNKVQAVLTRARERDFVDLYFLLREGPDNDLEHLIGLVRAKFDVGPSRVTLAESLLRAEELTELPEMIRPVTLEEIRRPQVLLEVQVPHPRRAVP